MKESGKKRLIIGMTGASGAVFGVTLLKLLRASGAAETHLIVSDAAGTVLKHELGLSVSDVARLADFSYSPADMAAPPASGSFETDGMIIAPCSAKTLSAAANGFGDNLISRAADVVLKERRRLVLLFREAPYHLAHIRNMASVTEMGGIIYPPVPAFYTRPETIDAMVRQTLMRVLALYDIRFDEMARWSGIA